MWDAVGRRGNTLGMSNCSSRKVDVFNMLSLTTIRVIGKFQRKMFQLPQLPRCPGLARGVGDTLPSLEEVVDLRIFPRIWLI
jgi:hypothetical protein